MKYGDEEVVRRLENKIKKQLDDTMKKHEQDLNNYEKSLQGY